MDADIEQMKQQIAELEERIAALESARVGASELLAPDVACPSASGLRIPKVAMVDPESSTLLPDTGISPTHGVGPKTCDVIPGVGTPPRPGRGDLP